MQKVAAYLLERRDGMDRTEERVALTNNVKDKILTWLRSKGATTDSTAGTYAAEDQSHATFLTEQAMDDSRTWWMVRLDEVASDGRRFTASISVTATPSSVAVYCSLEAGSDAMMINPIPIDPKTPRIVRTLLDMPGRWYHGASELRTLQRIKGFEDGESLAAEIADPARTVPIIVVTEENGEVALPKLDVHLAHDLAGLANVVHLDDDGTWALTEHLGPGFRCFGGAVRIFWPHFTPADDPFRHPRWTAARLASTGSDERVTLERFRKQVRSIIMRASALSVVRPRVIDEIRNASARRMFAEMKERASSLADYKELADSYSRDNDSLREEVHELTREIEGLRARVVELVSQKETLLVRIENAELQLRYRESSEPDISPTGEPDSQADEEPPRPGEVRFYKKKFNTSSHDVMVRVGDCGCGNWQSANKAEKAKKGIAKLEGGCMDWDLVQHCGSCTGGGMWKVRW